MGEAMVAYEGMKVAAEGIGQAMDQAHERMRMGAAGMTPAEIEDADKLSADLVQQYPSITQSDAMALARNARASFGSYETAKELLPEIAQSYVVAQAANPKADPEQIRQDYELLIKGPRDQGRYPKPCRIQADDGRDQQGHQRLWRYPQDFRLLRNDKICPPGGHHAFDRFHGRRRAGDRAKNARLVGGPGVRRFRRRDRRRQNGASGFKELLSLGLLTEADVDRTKTGEIKGLKPGHQIAGAELAATNQYPWEQKYLMPALTQNNILTPEQISEHLSKFLSNKYAAQLGLIYATQQPSIEKDLTMEGEAKGGASAKDFLAHDPLLASKALSNTLTNLIAANTPSGNSIAGLENVVTKGLQQLGEAARFSKEHNFFSDLKTDLEGWKGFLTFARISRRPVSAERDEVEGPQPRRSFSSRGSAGYDRGRSPWREAGSRGAARRGTCAYTRRRPSR